jgi:molybdopterin molybdotransferase
LVLALWCQDLSLDTNSSLITKTMLPVSEAADRIQQHLLPLPTETVTLPDATGRVLRQAIRADRDMPPFDRVAMDGIAISQAAFANGQRTFRIAGMQRAGQPLQTLTDPFACLEVMTGAMLPTGCDAVVRYEDITVQDGQATVNIAEVPPGFNIHPQATDRRADDELLAPGSLLDPFAIAVAASAGGWNLSVAALPRVALISTGDELVGIQDTPLPQQIRQSNTWMIRAALQSVGVTAVVHYLPDDEAILNQQMAALLADNDVLIVSGGVSAGKADFLPDTLTRLGVRKVFHQVAQRPGKPIWFGVVGPDTAPPEKVVFALPGNPVSTALCTYRYVMPWLRASLGLPPEPPRFAVLATPVTFRPALTYFISARLENAPDGRLLAHPIPGSGSADFANLLRASTFLELPGTERDEFTAGEVFRVWGA